MRTITGIEGLLAGRTLMNRYRVEEVIGRGGMGAVYRARDAKLGREVAVKVITVAAADPIAHARLRSRFHREARAAAALHHPCIVAIHDYGTDPDLALDFIVMELLRGEDLASRLERKGTPAVGTALSIVEQAARGLAVGHRAGLIHRDVKPGNIFLESGDRQGEVRAKILDFGIAELATGEGDTVTHLTVAGRSPFSPAYASPEQMGGDPGLTPATDVFSLGAVAFQLLTGRRLFTTAEPRQMVVELSRSLAEARANWQSTSPRLAEVLERALAPAPADRFPHAGALADALSGVQPHTRETAEPALRVRTEEADETRFLEPAPPAAPDRHAISALAPPVAGSPPLAKAPGTPPDRSPSRTGHWLRRTAAAVWSFILTATAFVIFGASWIAAFTGVQSGDLELVYMGTLGSIFATPVVLHRLMGANGSWGLGIFASLAATLGCVYALGGSEMELVLGTVFAAQLFVCVLVEWLTGRSGDLATPTSPPD